MFYKDFSVDIKSVDENEAIIEAVFSTAEIDRHGEKVDQTGWQLKDFKKNPVILWGHDHTQPAIGKAVKIGLDEKGNLAGKIQFAVKENPFANTIYQLFVNGFMKAFSVGYICEEMDFDKKDTPIHKINTLLEISAVNVPANALALAKQKGIDITQLEPQETNKNSDLKDDNTETGIKTPETENNPEITDFNDNSQEIVEGEEIIENNNEDLKQEEEISEDLEEIENDDTDELEKSLREDISKTISTLRKIQNLLRDKNEVTDSQEIKRSKPQETLGGQDTVKKLNRVIRVLIKNKNQMKERKLKIKL